MLPACNQQARGLLFVSSIIPVFEKKARYFVMVASQIFHTSGRRLFGQIFNGAATRPATLYILLRQLDGVSGHPSDAAAADTLASNLQECTGSGYARQSFTNNSTNVTEAAGGVGSADSVLTCEQVTFTFTGTINGITHAGIATSSDNSGVLITSMPLAVTRNVANTDTIKVTCSLNLTQG